MKRLLLISALLLPGLSSCSMVYSPFLELGTGPLSKGQSELAASAEVLPAASSSFGLTNGGSVAARQGISDDVSVGVRMWSALGSIQSFRIDGASLDGIVMLTPRNSEPSASEERVQFALMPRLIAMRNGDVLGGGAVTTSLAAWLPTYRGFCPSFGFGAVYGIGKTTNDPNLYFGAGFIGNAALSLRLSELAELSGELAFPGIYESLSRGWKFSIVPSARASVRF